MDLRDIKGYPKYKMDVETGVVYSNWKGSNPVIKKPYSKAHRKCMFINLWREGKWNALSYYRLRYAVENNIPYDIIPEYFCIKLNENGSYSLSTKRDNAISSCRKLDEKRKNERLKVIDTKINEILIIRRAYLEQSHEEAVNYLEGRKNLYIYLFMKNCGVSKNNAEYVYALAIEKIIERIDSPFSGMTDLSMTMMHKMHSVWSDLRKYKSLGYRDKDLEDKERR